MAELKDENIKIRIPELKRKDDTTNYTTWAVKVKNRLTNLGLWDVVGGTNATPPIIPPLRAPKHIQGIGPDGMLTEVLCPGNQAEVDAATAAAVPWAKKNGLALEIVQNAVSEDLFYLVG
jgi:hypothetical protein